MLTLLCKYCGLGAHSDKLTLSAYVNLLDEVPFSVKFQRVSNFWNAKFGPRDCQQLL